MGARFGLEGWPEKAVPRKLSSQTEGVGGAIPPEEATERLQAPTSLLMLSVPLHLYSSTDKLLHIGSGAARQALVISDFPIFPPPVPRDIALEPAQGKLSPLCARGRGAKSRADLAHLFQDFLRVLGILELARKASDFHERAVQLLIEELDAAALVRARLKQRVFARPLGGRPPAHAVGFSRSHACTHRKAAEEVILSSCGGFFLSIWDHSSIWRAFFLFSAFACEDFCSLPRGSRRRRSSASRCRVLR